MSTHSSVRASVSASSRSSFKPTTTPSTIVTVEPSTTQKPPNYAPDHHVGRPPTAFKNPWPSSPPPHSLLTILQARFFNKAERNFVPVPTDRSQLVPVLTPDWGTSGSDVSAWTKLRATWIGHASFLVEFPSRAPGHRGVRVLLDPVFSERMSPFTFIGPKRFTPPPCTLEELPEVDLVCISHNHYDHCDATTLRFLQQRSEGRVRFLCGLGVGNNLQGIGIRSESIVEMDWWDGVVVSVRSDGRSVGEVKVVSAPCQHISGRGIRDHGQTLWCSFVLEEILPVHKSENKADEATTGQATPRETDPTRVAKKLFFGGDTAYRSIPQGATEEQIAGMPVCTAFKQTGDLYGPFDLSLLPIGCYSPRWWMSAVHAAPEDSICIHNDIKSKKSIGMHYGVLRGGISQYYEDVTEPPKRWRESCEKAGLRWGEEIALCGVGETVSV